MGWLLPGLFLVALMIGWLALSEWRNTYRYRMTVEVQTPQGVRSGSAVREVKHHGGNGWNWLPSFIWFGEQRPQWRLRGEAVAVDLPDGKTLFALLRSEESLDLAGQEAWLIFQRTGEDEVELWPTAPKGLTEISATLRNPVPMLVAFADIDDPKTVEKVEPANLAVHFGPGVRLKRIWIETTGDPVTTGIEKRLEWLATHRGSLVSTGRLHPGNPEKDSTPSAFVQGIK